LIHSCVSTPVSSGIELISPENNSVNVPFNSILFSFKGTIGKTYDIIVKDSVTNAIVYTTSVKAESEVVQVPVPKGTFAPDKKYKWYVRLTNNDSKSSTQWVFYNKEKLSTNGIWVVT